MLTGDERRLAASLLTSGRTGVDQLQNLLAARSPDATLADLMVRRGIVTASDLATLQRSPSGPIEPDALEEAVQTLGRYDLIRELGRGGMGRVYLAYDAKLKRIVALKAMRTEGAEDRARFEREVEIAARLQHPHIVSIYDSHAVGTTFLISMQYVDGAPLGREPLTLRPALQALSEATRALQFAHENGIIHRDLKPDNLLRARDGRVFVLDFGIARPIDRTSSVLTQTGSIVGTPAFMSPEQASGKSLDVRTDVYSLGATLYAVLLGRNPFEGGSILEVMQAVIVDEPTAPRRLDPRLPKDVETIVLKAMRKDPLERYPTASELAEDLERFLAGDTIRARPLAAPLRAARWLKRRPWVTATIGVAALGLVASVFLLARQSGQETRLRRADALAEEAARKVDEWDRLIHLPARDLTPHRGLLEEAVRLTGAATEERQGPVPAGLRQKARALLRLGQPEEAERALDEALAAANEPRLLLDRAQLRLGRQKREMAEPSQLYSSQWAMLAGNPTHMRKELARRRFLPGVLEDLEAARKLGRDAPFEKNYVEALQAAFDGDFPRAESVAATFLPQASPWEQAELHHLLAWTGYLRWVLAIHEADVEKPDLTPSPHLAAAVAQVTKAVEIRRSDGELYLFRAYVQFLRATEPRTLLQTFASASSSRVRPEELWQRLHARVREDAEKLNAAQQSALSSAAADIDTALTIRPGDPDAWLMRSIAHHAATPILDFLELSNPGAPKPQDRARRQALGRRVLKDGVEPADHACDRVLEQAPGHRGARVYRALFHWHGALISLFFLDDPQRLVGAVESCTQAVALGLDPPQEAWVRFMRGMLRVWTWQVSGRKDEEARKAALEDAARIKELVPAMGERLERMVGGASGPGR
jgi:tetratricopeptide (TPR) repeat protein